MGNCTSTCNVASRAKQAPSQTKESYAVHPEPLLEERAVEGSRPLPAAPDSRRAEGVDVNQANIVKEEKEEPVARGDDDERSEGSLDSCWVDPVGSFIGSRRTVPSVGQSPGGNLLEVLTGPSPILNVDAGELPHFIPAPLFDDEGAAASAGCPIPAEPPLTQLYLQAHSSRQWTAEELILRYSGSENNLKSRMNSGPIVPQTQPLVTDLNDLPRTNLANHHHQSANLNQNHNQNVLADYPLTIGSMMADGTPLKDFKSKIVTSELMTMPLNSSGLATGSTQLSSSSFAGSISSASSRPG